MTTSPDETSTASWARPLDGLSSAASDLTFRTPTIQDGKVMWRLAQESDGLEINSAYSYLLVCRHFADTCVIAEVEGQPVGFISAHRPPNDPKVVFVWQIGVSAKHHGKGIGGWMLDTLVRLPGCRDVRFLEATVTPSNTASKAVFRGLARHLEVECAESDCFDVDMFPLNAHESDGLSGAHEPERLFRIGPFSLARTH